MEFKKSWKMVKGASTKTVVTLKCDDLQTWAKNHLTAEELDACLWYGMGLDYFKPKFFDLDKEGKRDDAVAKCKSLFGNDVTLTFDVPSNVPDETTNLLKQASPEMKAKIQEMLRAELANRAK